MKMFRLTAWVLALVLYAQVAFASGHPGIDANVIRAKQAQIRADAAARKSPYTRLGADKLSDLSKKQDVVDKLLPPDVQLVTDLNEHDQIALFNALQSIQTIVNDAEDQRLVCERHKPTGSKRPVTVCRSVAERKLDRENAENEIARRFQFCKQRADGTCE